MQQSECHTSLAAAVRSNATSAAIAAACLIYFGFFHLSHPTGNDWFSLGNLILFYSLRIGGVALAVVAAWSLLGHSGVLIVDAAISVPIGLAFIVSGILMLVDGGGTFQSVLILIFGAMFISAGVRNGKLYFSSLAEDESDPPPYEV